MSGVDKPTQTEVKPKMFKVRLNHERYQQPTINNLKVGGRIYGRGGYAFTANTEHVVPESEIDKFKIGVKGKDGKCVFDPNLIIEPIRES